MKKFNTNADLDYACRQLAAQDAGLAHVYETYGPPRMRRQPTGFPGLVRILIGQQVSIAAAAAIQRQKIALRRRQRAKSGSRPRGVVESNANDRQYRRRTADRLEGLGIHNVLLLFGGCGAGGRRRRRA